jgi:hypothetical protein
MDGLAVSYAAAGRTQEALKLGEEALRRWTAVVGPDHPSTAASIYNMACCHALMVPKSGDGARHADLAMGWLKRAVAAGFRDLAAIQKDSDLDALRGREDFKKLLAELEAGGRKK